MPVPTSPECVRRRGRVVQHAAARRWAPVVDVFVYSCPGDARRDGRRRTVSRTAAGGRSTRVTNCQRMCNKASLEPCHVAGTTIRHEPKDALDHFVAFVGHKIWSL